MSNKDTNEFFKAAGQTTPSILKKKDYTYEKPVAPKLDTSGLQAALNEEKRRKAFDQKQKTVNPKMWHG